MKKFTLPLTLILLPAIAGAQYEPLVNLPAFDGLQSGGFDAYINAVYAMFISIAALLAVVKIIVAGVKYMFSDIVTQKSDAKNDIKGALIGLVVIVAAVVILTVINPNLTRFNLDIQANRAGEATETNESIVAESQRAIQTCVEAEICTVLGCRNNDCTNSILQCAESFRNPVPTPDNTRVACIGDENSPRATDVPVLDSYACSITTPSIDCTDARRKCIATGRTPEVGDGYSTYVECN